MSKRDRHITYSDDDGTEHTVPYKWAICPACHGEGRSSEYLGAYTESEMDEAGNEFRHDYMAGTYDRMCDACEGAGKIKVPDMARMTAPEAEAIERDREAERDYQASVRAEQLAGC